MSSEKKIKRQVADLQIWKREKSQAFPEDRQLLKGGGWYVCHAKVFFSPQ